MCKAFVIYFPFRNYYIYSISLHQLFCLLLACVLHSIIKMELPCAYLPTGRLYGERHVRGKWACRQCETLVQTPVPAQIIGKGIPYTGLLVQILVANYHGQLGKVGTIRISHLPSGRKLPLTGGIMMKPKIQEDMLEGIESNIEITERNIGWLKKELASLRINNGPVEQRRVIRQQLSILQDTLQLLKIRRVYASEVTVH
jgi:hypothetical protein